MALHAAFAETGAKGDLLAGAVIQAVREEDLTLEPWQVASGLLQAPETIGIGRIGHG